MIKESIRKIILIILTFLAKAVLKKHKPRVIVVSGSVGKTSTKDALYTALKKSAFVRKSEKSFNSDIGVPLTILGLPNGWSNIAVWLSNILKGVALLFSGTPYPHWLIVEVGADRPGDISKSLNWVTSNIVVLTRFPDVPVHVEFYDSPEDVVREEMYPVTLLEEGGVAVLNADDPHTKDVVLKEGVKKITYGFDKDADVRVMRYRVNARQGLLYSISFEICYQDEKASVTIPGVVGEQHAYAVVAGVSGAVAAGFPLKASVENMSEHTSPPGRMRLIEGKNNSVIIDDTYNSSPVAVHEALNTMSASPILGRKIAVLGDMLELGSFSQKEHEKVGEHAKEVVDVLVTVGVRAQGIADKAKSLGMEKVYAFERGKDAIKFLDDYVEEGDTILIKGSQSIRMEKITAALMAEPEKAKELLPRQDIEWLTR